MTDLRKAAEMSIEAIMDGDVKDKAAAVYALRQALAQPEQEPLVWMNKYGHVSSEQTEEYNAPLYTAPPKREWQGLTDDEIGWIWHKSPPGSHSYARAIEAKLKEKNT